MGINWNKFSNWITSIWKKDQDPIPVNRIPKIIDIIIHGEENLVAGGDLNFEIITENSDKVASYSYKLNGMNIYEWSPSNKIKMTNILAGNRTLYVFPHRVPPIVKCSEYSKKFVVKSKVEKIPVIKDIIIHDEENLVAGGDLNFEIITENSDNVYLYGYKLNGMDKYKWSTSNKIKMTDILAGKRTLYVSAENNSEYSKKFVVKSKVEVIVPPIVVPPREGDKLADFRGKSSYIYYLNNVYLEENGINNTIKWLKEMNMQSVFLRIIGKNGWSATQSKQAAKDLVKYCNDEDIAVVPWGYLYQNWENPEQYGEYIIDYLGELGANTFIHNLEREWEDDPLTIEKEYAERYWKHIKKYLPNVCHGLSSFWKVDSHPLAWDIHAQNVDIILPQAYWYHKDSVETIQRAIEQNSIFNLPLNITIQNYWNEAGTVESEITKDFKQVCDRWNADLKDIVLKNKVIGIGQWHLGGKGASAFNEEMEEAWRKFNPILYKG